MANKVYEIIQKKVINDITEQIEEMKKNPDAKFKWVMPWGLDMPFNDNKGNYYRGINLLLLKRGGAYLTEKAINERGYSLKPDAKWDMVVFWKYPKEQDEEKDIEDAEQEDKYHAPILRYYKVYHESFIEGFERKHHIMGDLNLTLDEKEASLEHTLTSYCEDQGINLDITRSNRAYYSPMEDAIVIPELSQYGNKAEYLSTFSHESVHSTGCEKRLNRKGFVDMSKSEYSKEELVAELGAAMMLAMYGIEDVSAKNNSIAYLSGWLTQLKDDISLITYAAQRAQRAVDFIQEYENFDNSIQGYENFDSNNKSVDEIQGFGETLQETSATLGTSSPINTTQQALVNIIDYLTPIVDEVVHHYKSDFDIDTNALLRSEPGDVYYWLPRNTGTTLTYLESLRVDPMYSKWSSAGILEYYTTQEVSDIYRIEVTDIIDNQPYGIVYKTTAEDTYEEINSQIAVPTSIEVTCRGEELTYEMEKVPEPQALYDRLDRHFCDVIHPSEVRYRLRYE